MNSAYATYKHGLSYSGASSITEYSAVLHAFYTHLRTGQYADGAPDGNLLSHSFTGRDDAGVTLHQLAGMIREIEESNSSDFQFASFPTVMKLSSLLKTELFPRDNREGVEVSPEAVMRLREQVYHVVPVIAVASYSNDPNNFPHLRGETNYSDVYHKHTLNAGTADGNNNAGYVHIDTTDIGNASSMYAIQAAVSMYARPSVHTYLRFIPLVTQAWSMRWLDDVAKRNLSDQEVGILRDSFFKFGGASLGMSVCSVLRGSGSKSWVFATGHTDGPMKGISKFLKLQHFETGRDDKSSKSLLYAQNPGAAIYQSFAGGACPDDLLHMPDYILPKCAFVVNVLNCPILVPHCGIFSQSSDAFDNTVNKLRSSIGGTFANLDAMPSTVAEPINLLHELRKACATSIQVSAPERFHLNRGTWQPGIYLVTTACEQMYVTGKILQEDILIREGVQSLPSLVSDLSMMRMTREIISQYKQTKVARYRSALAIRDPVAWQQEKLDAKREQIAKSKRAFEAKTVKHARAVETKERKISTYKDSFSDKLQELYNNASWKNADGLWQSLGITGRTKPAKSKAIHSIRVLWPARGAIGLQLAKYLKKIYPAFDESRYNALENNNYGSAFSDVEGAFDANNVVALLRQLYNFKHLTKEEASIAKYKLGENQAKFAPANAKKVRFVEGGNQVDLTTKRGYVKARKADRNADKKDLIDRLKGAGRGSGRGRGRGRGAVIVDGTGSSSSSSAGDGTMPQGTHWVSQFDRQAPLRMPQIPPSTMAGERAMHSARASTQADPRDPIDYNFEGGHRPSRPSSVYDINDQQATIDDDDADVHRYAVPGIVPNLNPHSTAESIASDMSGDTMDATMIPYTPRTTDSPADIEMKFKALLRDIKKTKKFVQGMRRDDPSLSQYIAKLNVLETGRAQLMQRYPDIDNINPVRRTREESELEGRAAMQEHYDRLERNPARSAAQQRMFENLHNRLNQ